MERYSFTLQQLLNERINQSASSPNGRPLFTQVEVLHIAYGLAQALHHLYFNGFIHR
jgi:serine/threonine protein kinase